MKQESIILLIVVVLLIINIVMIVALVKAIKYAKNKYTQYKPKYEHVLDNVNLVSGFIDKLANKFK